MSRIHSLRWPLVLGLGALALIRPLMRIVESQLGIDSPAIVPVAMTVLISVIWIAVVGLGTAPEPVLTLVCTGLAYGVLALVLSGILSPILDGQLAGPLANPIAVVPVLLINAAWGLVAGGLALLVRRARGVRPPSAPRSR